MHACTNLVALAVELHIAVARAKALNGMTWCAPGLIADEQHVMPRVAEQGFKVVDDATAGAHSVAGNDDGAPRTADKMIGIF